MTKLIIEKSKLDNLVYKCQELKEVIESSQVYLDGTTKDDALFEIRKFLRHYDEFNGFNEERMNGLVEKMYVLIEDRIQGFISDYAFNSIFYDLEKEVSNAIVEIIGEPVEYKL